MVCFLIDFSFPTSSYRLFSVCHLNIVWQPFFEEIFRESYFTKPVNCIISCMNISGWREISMLVFIAEEGKGSKEKGKEKNEIFLIKVIDISHRITPRGTHFLRLFVYGRCVSICLPTHFLSLFQIFDSKYTKFE